MSTSIEERLRSLYDDLTSTVPEEGPGLGVVRSSDLTVIGDIETQRNRWPWILSTAAALVLVVGLVVVTRSQPRDSTPVGPAVTEAPIADTVATSDPPPSTAPSTTLAPELTDGLRFADPLAATMIATIDPAPAAPALAFDLGRAPDGWAYGRDAVTRVWVLLDGEWVGSLSVYDQGLPWEIAVEGLTPTSINGVDAVVDQAQAAVALRLDNGGTRVIQSSMDGPTQPELSDSAVELAGVIGVNPIDTALPTDRFVVPIGVSAHGPLIRYGDPLTDQTTEVAMYRLERTPSVDELRWIGASVRWMRATQTADEPEQIDTTTFETTLTSGQRFLLELVSPLDVVTVLAPADTEMSTVRESLVFETIEQSGLTVGASQPATPEVVARGQHSWGRWQVSTSIDEDCRSISYVLWSAGQILPSGTGASSCDPARTYGPAICASPQPDLMLVVALGADADSVSVEVNGVPISQTIENGEDGAAVLIDSFPAGPNPITVHIDGVAFNCDRS
jgi:hypothetical protein